jgi:drug/metabolite transporter (DMT)-like permease
MNFNASLLVPLACALIYVIGALTVKRSAAFGVGVWRTSFLSNVALAVLFVPVWFLYGGEIHAWADYWQPAVTALCFFGGQALTFLALSRGDVSVTTPVMGTKVILVALFSSLLRVGEVPLQWWIGAALSTAAIGLLHLGGEARHRHVGRTVLLAFGSATSFSLGDVLVGSATVVNIIYSVRGLFSVLLVWLIGHWFTNDEKHLGGRVLRLRFVGATLMVAAIVLVLI